MFYPGMKTYDVGIVKVKQTNSMMLDQEWKVRINLHMLLDLCKMHNSGLMKNS